MATVDFVHGFADAQARFRRLAGAVESAQCRLHRHFQLERWINEL
jgi:hypothetical protein